MSQKCVKPVAGQKIKDRNTDEPLDDAIVPYDNDNRWTGMNSNLASSDPPSQYQRLKLIQHTVRVDASSYSMNKAALNVYETPQNNETVINWNQMSDRMQPHIQTARMSMKSSTSIRPGNMSPGGVGCDIKHNSYDRYLARLKGSGPLRKDNLKITYGQPIKFNPADPIYGGKTVKTSIGSSLCGCGTFIEPFIEIFAYTFDVIDNPNIDFTPYIPIIHNDKLEYINTITVKNNKVTVNIQYVFFDNETTIDGVSFNGLADFYNNHTRNLQITTFGKIPISRGGSQFKGLRKLPLFPTLLTDLPTILDNTSLSYCFANVIDFNGLEEKIMTILRTELIIDTSFMFYRSAFNIPDFTLDITYIDTLEGMFQETTEFNPSIFYMNVREITNNVFYSRFNVENAKVGRPPKLKPLPKPKKIVVSLLSKAKAFKGIKFTYFNANAQIKGKVSMRQYSHASKLLSDNVPAEPAIMEDISQMFYECPNFDPDKSTDPETSNFQFTAAPIKMDYAFFNASKFNAPLYAPRPPNANNSNSLIYGSFDVTYTKSMDYTFSGTQQFNNALNSWELPNLENSVNVFSQSAIEIQNIPNYFAFGYTFIGDSGLKALILNNLPIIQTGPLEINAPSIIETPIDVTTSTSNYKINFNFRFTDDGITNDGLTFENVITFYNTYAPTGITINKFSGLQLSRAGLQFANLTMPLIFSKYLNDDDTTLNIPSIVPNTSLNKCFFNTKFFNSDISKWITLNVTDMTSLFQGATAFNTDISEWVVKNVSYYGNFVDNTYTFNLPPFIQQPGFIYSFNYTGPDDEVDFKQYIPIKNDNNSFTTNIIVTPSISKFIIIQIIFTADNVIGDDGLSFYISGRNLNNPLEYIYEFYNNFTTGLTIVQYGGITLSNSGFQFANLDVIHVSALDAPTILPNTDFYGFTANSEFNYSIDNWNIFDNNNTNWSGMFWQSVGFNQDISRWNTQYVTDMSEMFNGAKSFTNDLSGWKVSSVIYHTDFATDALQPIIEPKWLS